jgi:hypothetical protein
LAEYTPGFLLASLLDITPEKEKRHPYIMQLIYSPLCRRYGAEKEISAHNVCECEALATLRHAYLSLLKDQLMHLFQHFYIHIKTPERLLKNVP